MAEHDRVARILRELRPSGQRVQGVGRAWGLTLYPIWALAVTHGGKRIENRSWATNWRGPLLIHAGQNLECLDDRARLLKRWVAPDERLDEDEIDLAKWQDAGGVAEECRRMRGHVVAVCLLARCGELGMTSALHRSDRHWALKGFRHWRFEDVVRLPEPVPAKGAQRLWRPGEDVVLDVVIQLLRMA